MADLSIDLSSFNSKDVIQFIPYFEYDDGKKNIATIILNMPAFPSQLGKTGSTLKAEKTVTGAIDSKKDSTNTYRIIGFKNFATNNGTSTNRFEVFLEGKWYWPYTSNEIRTTGTWNKVGVSDVSAESLNKDSIMLFIASAGNSLASLNGKTYKIYSTTNTIKPTSQTSLPTTGSVKITFLVDAIGLTKSGDYKNSTSVPMSSVNMATAAIQDFQIYEKYDRWRLSVDRSYSSTLNNNDYVRDVVIFGYRIGNAEANPIYLVKAKNSNPNSHPNISQLNITTTLPTYSNITSDLSSSTYYIDGDGNSRMSILTDMYNNLGGAITFYAKVIRYEDTTGNANFSNSNVSQIHDWKKIGV